MRDLVLYCNCFADHEPRHRQALQRDLMCGAANLTTLQRDDLRGRGFLFDDQGQNISSDNQWLGDLTGLYWVWKNTQDEWVGTNQYRRFYHDDVLSGLPLSMSTLCVSAPIQFDFSLADQYRWAHGDIGLQVLWEAANQNRVSLTTAMVEQLSNLHAISTCNMFFAHRTVFDRLCAVLFEIIFELQSGVRYCLPYIQIDPAGKRQTRMLAFLAERILTIIYNNSQHFLGNVNITPIPYQTYG